MSIDEAITHCLEVADGHTEQGWCPECAMEHRKLAEWLTDYKRLKKQEPCNDIISRTSIKQKLQEHHDFFVDAYGGFSNLPQNDKTRVDEITNCIAMVVNEPPVNPQKTGHWIDNNNGSISCSYCHTWFYRDDRYSYMHYCPKCGCRMYAPQERSGEE